MVLITLRTLPLVHQYNQVLSLIVFQGLTVGLTLGLLDSRCLEGLAKAVPNTCYLDGCIGPFIVSLATLSNLEIRPIDKSFRASSLLHPTRVPLQHLGVVHFVWFLLKPLAFLS